MPEVILTLDSSGAIKGLRDYENEVDRAGKTTDSAFSKMRGAVSGIGAVFGILSAAAGSALTLAAAKSVTLAGNLVETQNKFDVVFKGMTNTAEKWADDLQKNYGLTENASKKFLASTQDLLKPMGIATDEAGKLSFSVSKLAVDLGSFNDLPTAQVMDDIQSALVGNYETMKKYGVVVNSTTITQEALTTGLIKNKNELTAAQKAQIALTQIMRGSADAMGDWNRSSESFNNQMKLLKTNIETVQTEIGTYLLPYVNQAVTLFNQWAVEGEGIQTFLLGFIETVRFLYNGFMGLNIVLKSIILGFAYMLDKVVGLLKPFELVLAGLKAIGAIDSNPLKTLSDTMNDFVESAKEGLNQTWKEVEQMNLKFDEAKAKIRETGTTHTEVFNKMVQEENAYQQEIAESIAYVNQQHNIEQQRAVSVESSTARVISALNGESDALQLINGKWVNVKDTAAQYGRVVSSYVAPAQDQGTNATKKLHGELNKIENKFKEAAGCADCYTAAVNGAAAASDRVNGGGGGSGEAEPKSGKTYTFSGRLPQTKEEVLASMKGWREVWRVMDTIPGQSRPSLNEFTVWNQAARDANLKSRIDKEERYRNMFLEMGGTIREWVFGQLETASGPINNDQGEEQARTTNVFVNQSVSRSDIANITNEIERNGARA